MAVAAGFELTLHLAPSLAPASLDQLFWRAATPGSPDYLNFFTSPEAAAPWFGGTTVAIREASEWLNSLNGTDIRVSAMRDRVTASFSRSVNTSSVAWSTRGLPLGAPPSTVQLVTRRDPPQRVGGTTVRPSAPPLDDDAPRDTYNVASIKRAYKLPTDLAATNPQTLQMVWGPGTFGFSRSGLIDFKQRECPGLNPDKVAFDTPHHGSSGGDNWAEGTLDVHMISAFGMNVSST